MLPQSEFESPMLASAAAPVAIAAITQDRALIGLLRSVIDPTNDLILVNSEAELTPHLNSRRVSVALLDSMFIEGDLGVDGRAPARNLAGSRAGGGRHRRRTDQGCRTDHLGRGVSLPASPGFGAACAAVRRSRPAPPRSRKRRAHARTDAPGFLAIRSRQAESGKTGKSPRSSFPASLPRWSSRLPEASGSRCRPGDSQSSATEPAAQVVSAPAEAPRSEPVAEAAPPAIAPAEEAAVEPAPLPEPIARSASARSPSPRPPPNRHRLKSPCAIACAPQHQAGRAGAGRSRAAHSGRAAGAHL